MTNGCCLELPAIPNNEADGLVKVAWGNQPNFPGVAPEFSWFTVDIQPGGPGVPTPPIPAGRYAAWCFDVATELAPPPNGILFGGYLFSSCDPSVAFNQYLPGHPNVQKDAATWKRINYLINHRFQACGGLVPRMWEVQRAIWTLMGQPLTTVPSPPYPPYRANVVQCLVDSAIANAPSWQLSCGDKIAVIYNVDVNWDTVAPEVQLIFLEVPYCPPISCPPDVTVNCEQVASGALTNLTLLGQPTTDPCCPITNRYVDVITPGNCPNSYTITRTWTSIISCATKTCVQTITVVDNTPPTLTVPQGAALGCNPTLVPTDDLIRSLVTATDLCGQVITNVSHIDEPNGCSITRTFTVTAVDECGNTAGPKTIVFTWKVDKEAPVLIGLPPATATYSCEMPVPAAPTVTALDNCDTNLTVHFTETPSGDACSRTLTRVWSAVDGCGNPVSFTQVVTVRDTTGPVLTIPDNVEVECDSIPEVGIATATDNCDSNPVITFVGETNMLQSCTNFLLRTWKAVDACGNPSFKTQTITLVDTTAPVLDGVPDDVAVECTDVPAVPEVTATDACDTNTIAVIFSQLRTNGDCTNNYTLLRTWIATDICGNSVTNTQTIVVTDTTEPVITAPADRTVECGQSWAFGNPTATDTCGKAVVTILGTETNRTGCGFTATRTWVATDACGNTATATQTVSVVDNTPPVITCSPNKTVACGSALSFDAPTATDNCGTVTIKIISTVTATNKCVVTSTRTWKATDACGNVAQCSQTLTSDCGSLCVKKVFKFDGSTSSYGTCGNVRTYTVNGLSVRVSAFSRVKSTGAWATAFLGAYSGGLGVTDTSEGTGSGNSHTVDNIGRDNFVLFEFSEPVAVKKATLGYVVDDSDFMLWVGNFANPYANHMTLSDALLGSFSHVETNLTGSSSARTALFNNDDVVGNAFVVAALPGTSWCDDQFKISMLEICQSTCEPPPPPCSGSICGKILRDCNADGSLYGEEGLEGMTVKLRNSAGTIVGSTMSEPDGEFCFSGLSAGSYTVEVVPGDYCQTYDPDSYKNDKTTVTLGACEAKSGIKFGYTGTDASVYLVKTGPATAKVGETITFKFAVTNTGNTCLYGGMSIYDPMLGGTIWQQSPVVPGEGFVITKTYTVKSTDPKLLCNTATAIGHPPTGYAVKHQSSWTVSISNVASLPKPNCPVVQSGNCYVKLNFSGISGCTSFKIKRSLTSGGPYTVIKSGYTSTSYTDTTCDNGKLYYYVISCMVNGVESPNSDEACAVPSAGLPSPWQTRDIGNVGLSGNASYASGTRKFTLIGSGEDIWNGSDEFRFAYQVASGNCTIVARVASVGNTDPWAKAGIMIRDNLTSGSEHASLFVTPGNGVAAQYRDNTGGSSENVNTTGLSAPYWVKLIRSGNTFTAYRSANGSSWTHIGSKTIYMSSTVYIGLAVTSHKDGTACTATFDNVTVSP